MPRGGRRRGGRSCWGSTPRAAAAWRWAGCGWGCPWETSCCSARAPADWKTAQPKARTNKPHHQTGKRAQARPLADTEKEESGGGNPSGNFAKPSASRAKGKPALPVAGEQAGGMMEYEDGRPTAAVARRSESPPARESRAGLVSGRHRRKFERGDRLPRQRHSPSHCEWQRSRRALTLERHPGVHPDGLRTVRDGVSPSGSIAIASGVYILRDPPDQPRLWGRSWSGWRC